MQYLILFLASILSILFSSAAPNGGCGTVMPANYQHATSEAERLSGVFAGSRAGIKYVPIVYHIVQKSDGSGGVSLQTVFETNCELNKGFQHAQIYFFIRDIDTIKNNTLWAMDDGSGGTNYQAGYSAFSNYNLNNTCNVYITGQLPGLCGFATYPGSGVNGGGLFLNKDCCGTDGKTIPHEMGHYLNLPHTFENSSGTEYVDGSNCAWAGDGFCGTPADFLDYRVACPYNGPQTDGHGDLYNTVIDETLFMSYFSDNCISRFSNDEEAEMNAVLTSSRSYLMNQSMPSVTPLDSVPIVYPQGGNLTVNATPVEFRWNKIPNILYYNLFIQSGTSSIVIVDTLTTDTTFTVANLVANKSYKYKVRPISYGSTCAENSAYQLIKISTVKVTLVANNPTCAGINDGSVSVTPTVGTAPYSYLWSTGANTQVVTNLAPGFYTVTITDGAGKIDVAGVQLNGNSSILVNIIKSGSNLIASGNGGNAPYSYNWSNGASGSTNNNVGFGNYTVTITDQNGCSAAQTFVYSALGIELETKVSMKVFPNPANNVASLNLRIELNERTDATVTLLNVNGEVLEQLKKEFSSGVNITTMNISNLPSGVYFVQFKSNGAMKTEKISVIR